MGLQDVRGQSWVCGIQTVQNGEGGGVTVLSDNYRSAQAEMGIWLIWQHFVKRSWQQLTFIMSISIFVIIVQKQKGRQHAAMF